MQEQALSWSVYGKYADALYVMDQFEGYGLQPVHKPCKINGL
jgi:hypothetical protein